VTLEQKVRRVEELFGQLEKETAQFQQKSGLGCVSGCGKCCNYPHIEASPLEFLPWAFHLFLKGEAETTLDALGGNQNPTCFLFAPLSVVNQGHCGTYPYRGLICRLFGFAATRDKYGSLRLATCKIIKEGQAEQYRSVSEAIAQGLYVPVFTDYYMQLKQIDHLLGNKMMPVNKALKMALEEVLHYYTYRPIPDAGKWCV